MPHRFRFRCAICRAPRLPHQVVGPPLLKRALREAGEQHHNYVPKRSEQTVSGVGVRWRDPWRHSAALNTGTGSGQR